MNLFGYEWKKMIPKKGLLFIPLLYIYICLLILDLYRVMIYGSNGLFHIISISRFYV